MTKMSKVFLVFIKEIQIIHPTKDFRVIYISIGSKFRDIFKKLTFILLSSLRGFRYVN